MRVPLRWLGEFVDLPTAVTPEAVHAALVRVGLEEEAIHRPEVSGPIVVGEVLAFEAEPQSNGKTIRWCQVRVAADADGTPDAPAVRGIVCGAHNFVVGDRVVVTLPGAVLPGPFPIAARRTYGHVSDGMLASARELGLGEDHAGILRLTTLGIDAPVGTDAIALLGLDDAAVELNVTPDRGYALSIRGVAREYALATDAPFRDPVDALRAALDATPAPHSDTVSHPGVTLVDDAPIHNRVGCDVFATAVVQDVDGTRPTPPWLVARLRLAGVRPLSVLVDITNYVMLELGQPIHGYDADRLRGDIVVRRARPGERLTTLDAKDRALDPEDLLITDDRGPIGLAGVMGGADTELTATTRTVLIEAAHFDPVSIARTARRHRLPSEASRRFERGVDPAIAAAAATRVADLLCALAGGHRVGAVRVTGESATPAPITLPTDAVRLRVGIDPTLEVQADILRRVGARVDRVAAHQDALPAARPAAQALSVTPPTWRPDLTASEDLVEEIARLVGYDTIPSLLPQAPPGVGFTPDQRLRRAVIDAVVGAGATEILSFPFVSSADNARCGGVVRAASFPPALSHPVSAGEALPEVRLANPIDAKRGVLRRSMLSGLIGAAQRNVARGLSDLELAELGYVFRPDGPPRSVTLPPGAQRPDAAVLAELVAGIPPQPRHLGWLALGATTPRGPGQPGEPADLATALDRARVVVLAAGHTLTWDQGHHRAFHPGRCARLRVGDTVVGVAGECHPELAAEANLPGRPVAFEIDLDALGALRASERASDPLRVYPAATQDVSLVVAREIPAGPVMEAFAWGAGDLLEYAALIEDYRGAGVGADQKVLTMALRFRAEDRTLTAEDATVAKNAGVAAVTSAFGAALRE